MYVISRMRGYTQLLKGTGGKKFKMVFYDTARKKIKSVSFGSVGYEDFTTHGDLQRKQNYIQRHSAREDFSDPYTSGACARWILWNKTTLSASYKDFRNKFKYELF
jgi:hypothetical protein